MKYIRLNQIIRYWWNGERECNNKPVSPLLSSSNKDFRSHFLLSCRVNGWLASKISISAFNARHCLSYLMHHNLKSLLYISCQNLKNTHFLTLSWDLLSISLFVNVLGWWCTEFSRHPFASVCDAVGCPLKIYLVSKKWRESPSRKKKC